MCIVLKIRNHRYDILLMCFITLLLSYDLRKSNCSSHRIGDCDDIHEKMNEQVPLAKQFLLGSI